MKRLIITSLILLVVLSQIKADVLYRGWVRDSSGNPVASASVELCGDTLFSITGTDGAFVIQGVPSRVSPAGTLRGTTGRIGIYGNRIFIHKSAAGHAPLELSLYDIRGRRVFIARADRDFCEARLDGLSGMFILHVRAGTLRRSMALTVIRGVALDKRSVELFPESGGLARRASTAASFSTGPGYRVLAASKEGYCVSYCTAAGDSASGIAITLLDSARFGSRPPYLNPLLDIDARVDDLVPRMTFEEKLSQLRHDAAAVERLGIIEYNWWSECLHGVGIAYLATVFPQAIGMAATWDTALIRRVAAVISDEARAKYHRELEEYGRIRPMRGLTFFSPNINMFRDPRWGRGQETYGEDPFLTSRIAVAYINGLQGGDPRYLKAAATAKHFAVHSGPEQLRHEFNATPSPRDLWQTYLPAFRACVKEAGVKSIMCAYNRVDGTYACQNSVLLRQILRDRWGFKGFVVSDCGASISLEAGCDLVCYLGWENQQPYSAGEPEELVDASVKRLMRVRFELGMFDPPQLVPYASIPYSVVDCEKHRALARETARKSIVLLKNDRNLLPFGDSLGSVAVVGPHAHWKSILWGNYNGTPSYTVTPFEGIQMKLGAGKVYHAQGCGLLDSIDGEFARAESLARKADVVIACCGLSSESVSPVLEGEKSDRADLTLPAVQEELIRRLHATGTPVVLVLINGGPLAVTWADSNVAAIVEAWYGGQEAGRAIADVLFGDYNPAGRLPFTVYKSVDDLPDFSDYAMESGRTYRYFTGEPLYPFGYGLSYTTFAYGNLSVVPSAISTADDTIRVTAEVTNTGRRAGEEVAQLYVSGPFALSAGGPVRELKGFCRISLNPSETRRVTFAVTPYDVSHIDDSGGRVFEPGAYTFFVGGGQPGGRGTKSGVSTTIIIGGGARGLEL